MKSIDISSWKNFRLDELFCIKKGSRLTKANMKSGRINYIGASSVNNGVTAFIGNKERLHPGNTITVAYNGSVGEAFYQKDLFWATDDVNVLYPKFKLTTNVAMFLIPLIRKKGKQYAYIDKWTKEDMEKDTIPLPVKENGAPDWEYMEQFMSCIMKRQLNNIKEILSLIQTNEDIHMPL